MWHSHNLNKAKLNFNNVNNSISNIWHLLAILWFLQGVTSLAPFAGHIACLLSSTPLLLLSLVVIPWYWHLKMLDLLQLVYTFTNNFSWAQISSQT